MNPQQQVNFNFNCNQEMSSSSSSTSTSDVLDMYVCGSMNTRNDARMERAIDMGHVSIRRGRGSSSSSSSSGSSGMRTRTLARIEQAVLSGHLVSERPAAALPAGVTVRR